MNPQLVDAIERRRRYETSVVGPTRESAKTAAKSPVAADFLKRLLYGGKPERRGYRRLTLLELRLGRLCWIAQQRAAA